MTKMPRREKPWAGFRSVLCPIDFSEHSRVAVRYAEAIARRGRAALRVLYVNDPILVAAAAAALHDRQIVKRSKGELEAFAGAALTRGSGLRLRSHVAVGNPPDEILKFADRSGSDLIVIGTHGLTGADRLLMGSTTLTILQHTTVPVLAVPRRPADPAADAPSPTWPGDRLLAPLELASTSRQEVEIAAGLAWWFQSSLLLLHVIAEIGAPEWVRGDLGAHDRIRVAEAQQQLDRLAAIARRRVETEARVICGRIADEIAALAVGERLELLVTALRDRRGWFGARRGSVSYHVLSHAAAPVLACPPQWRMRAAG
jgi:nucleotide-binding universal stress UspA family protein